jgi:hypothetical protein
MFGYTSAVSALGGAFAVAAWYSFKSKPVRGYKSFRQEGESFITPFGKSYTVGSTISIPPEEAPDCTTDYTLSPVSGFSWHKHHPQNVVARVTVLDPGENEPDYTGDTFRARSLRVDGLLDGEVDEGGKYSLWDQGKLIMEREMSKDGVFTERFFSDGMPHRDGDKPAFFTRQPSGDVWECHYKHGKSTVSTDRPVSTVATMV